VGEGQRVALLPPGLRGHRMSIPGGQWHQSLVRANLPRLYWEATMQQVPETAPYRGAIRRYGTEMPRWLRDGVGLYLWSAENSTGKTALACILAMHALKLGRSVLFVRAQELKDGRIESVVFEDRTTLWDRVGAVDLLVLDDLGKEYRGTSSQYAETLMEDVVRSRVQQQRSTILTSNISPDKLKDEYSMDMKEVLREAMLVVPVPGAAGGVAWRSKTTAQLRAAFWGTP